MRQGALFNDTNVELSPESIKISKPLMIDSKETNLPDNNGEKSKFNEQNVEQMVPVQSDEKKIEPETKEEIFLLPEADYDDSIFKTKEEYENERILKKFWNRFQIERKKNSIFLMLGGSFNPVHNEHIQILEIAKRHCERHLGKVVVAGFLGVSSKDHVTGKCGSRGAITLKHRNAMCELAVANSDWISVCPFGWASPERIAERLQDAIKRQNWRVGEVPFLNVLGSDIFGDVPNSYRRQYHTIREDIICVSRDNSRVFEEIKKLGNNLETFYFAEGSTSSSTSSTQVRRLMKRKDWDGLKRFLDANVLQYLKQNLKNLWESSYS